MQHEEQLPAQNETENARPGIRKFAVVPRGSETKAYLVEVEEECEECGGNGCDWGSLSPIDPEECPACLGSGKQTVVRNYLAEALRIAAGKSSRVAQRERLVAVIQHCRAMVRAVIGVTDARAAQPQRGL
jgi:hypothetical protein